MYSRSDGCGSVIPRDSSKVAGSFAKHTGSKGVAERKESN